MRHDLNRFRLKTIAPSTDPKICRKTLFGCGLIITLVIAFWIALFMLASKAIAEPVTQSQMQEACNYAATKMHLEAMPYPEIVQDDERFYALVNKAQLRNVRAAYYIGRIYVLTTFNESFMPYLVHECVHHAQAIAAIKYPCHAAKERDAYQIQNQYSRERGTRVLIDDEHIEQFSKCESGSND